ncbi:MAG: hypothetical protein Q7T33_11190 [Dehalococcoidia bacterium]|nr:hypothetical protein [Dehalococcoidia bacterium]
MRFVALWVVLADAALAAAAALILGLPFWLWLAIGASIGCGQAILIEAVRIFNRRYLAPESATYIEAEKPGDHDVLMTAATLVIIVLVFGFLGGFTAWQWAVAIPTSIAMGIFLGLAWKFGRRFRE